MKVNRLILHPFAGIADLDVVFKSGVVLITGDNGQGKSTIPKALQLLLFDKSEFPLQKYVPWGGSFFQAETEFEHQGHCYKTSMRYDGATERWLWIDDFSKSPFTGAAEVTRKLAEILDPKLDLPACYAPQGKETLIYTTKAERREQAMKSFNVDLNEEIKLLQTEAQNLTDKTQSLSGEIQARQGMSFEPVIVPPPIYTSQEVFSLEKEKERIRGEINRLNSDLETKMKLKNEISLRLETHRKHTQRLSEVTRDLQEKEGLLTRLETMNPRDTPEARALLSDIQTADSKFAELKTSLKEAEDALDMANKTPLERVPSFDETGLTLAQKRLWSLQEEIKTQSRNLVSYQIGNCPYCNQPFTSPEKILETEEKLTALESELGPLKEEIKTLEDKRSAIKMKGKANTLLLEERSRLSEVFTPLARAVDTKKAELLSLQTRFDELLTRPTKQAESLRPLVGSLREQVKTLEALVEETRTNDSLEGLQEEIRQINQHLMLLSPGVREIEANLESHQKNENSRQVLEALNEKKKEEARENEILIQKLVAERDALLSRQGHVKLALGYFQKDFPLFIVMKKLQAVQDAVNNFLGQTKLPHRLTFKDEKSGLQVLYGPNQEDVRLASGYEAQLFSAAYLLALSKLRGLGWLVLDEPDAYASSANSAQFFEELISAAGSFNQVLVITHREASQDALMLEHKAQVLFMEGGRIGVVQ